MERPAHFIRRQGDEHSIIKLHADGREEILERGLTLVEAETLYFICIGQPVHEVIIQEGVYTFESVEGAVAEPVVYMLDQFVVGGFYRVHSGRGIDENLNSPGAQYAPLAFETDCHTPDCEGKPGDPLNRFYTYGVIARLANLAAAIEVEELVRSGSALEAKAANA